MAIRPVKIVTKTPQATANTIVEILRHSADEERTEAAKYEGKRTKTHQYIHHLARASAMEDMANLIAAGVWK